VPFEGRIIPVLSCTALVVFKAMFDRTQDWADIEAMVEARSFDMDEAAHWIRDMLGDDRRIEQLAAAAERRSSQGEPRPLRPRLADRPPDASR
jgi:hypothetical protein